MVLPPNHCHQIFILERALWHLWKIPLSSVTLFLFLIPSVLKQFNILSACFSYTYRGTGQSHIFQEGRKIMFYYKIKLISSFSIYHLIFNYIVSFVSVPKIPYPVSIADWGKRSLEERSSLLVTNTFLKSGPVTLTSTVNGLGPPPKVLILVEICSVKTVSSAPVQRMNTDAVQ